MRKAISLFLAAAVLCLSTSALAAVGTENVDGMRNSEDTLYSGYSGGSARSLNMPGFRPGDTISFDVTGVTNGNEMTLICYKYGAESDGLDNSEVIYINQYTLTASSLEDIRYKIPASAASGIYKVVINDSSNPVANFYFKVGTATVGVLNGDGSGNTSTNRSADFIAGSGSPYIIKKIGDTYSVGFVGKVTIESGDIRLQDIGANPGFAITQGSTTKKYGFGTNINGVNNTGKTVAGLDNLIEVGGSYSVIYGVTMYNVPDGSQNSITAQAVLDAAN